MTIVPPVAAHGPIDPVADGGAQRIPSTGQVHGPAPNLGPAHDEALLLPEQAELAQLWASALEIDVHGIRATDNFFQLGGDATRARTVTQQAQKVLGFHIDPARYAKEDLARLASATLATEPDASRQGADDRPGWFGRLFGALARKG